jgi:hypothetical protein
VEQAASPNRNFRPNPRALRHDSREKINVDHPIEFFPRCSGGFKCKRAAHAGKALMRNPHN